MQNNRTIPIIGGLLVVVLAATALIVALTHNSSVDRQYKYVTQNLQNAAQQGDELSFYSGSFFARYDLINHRFERLSDYLYIDGGINTVGWGSDAVVFQANPSQSTRDDITTAAQQLGVDPYTPHWWRYSFTQKQYQLLDLAGIQSCTQLLPVDNTHLACVQPQAAGNYATQLSVYDTAAKTSKKLVSSQDKISQLSVAGGRVYYIVTDFAGDERVESVATSTPGGQVQYRSKLHIAGYLAGSSNQLLVNEVPRLKEQDKKESAKQGDIGNKAISQKVLLVVGGETKSSVSVEAVTVNLYEDSSTKSLAFGTTSGAVYGVTGGSLKQLQPNAKTALANSDLLFSRGTQIYVLKTDYTLTSSPEIPRPAGKKLEQQFKPFDDNPDSGDSWIDEAKNGQREALIYLNNVPSSQQQLAVGQNLEQKGFIPSEFNLSWVLTGAGFNVPIAPKAVLIR